MRSSSTRSRSCTRTGRSDLGGEAGGTAKEDGGESLGRHETVIKEEKEVEEFGFQSREAAEAFAQACESIEGVGDVWTDTPIDE